MDDKLSVFLGFVAGFIVAKNLARITKWICFPLRIFEREIVRGSVAVATNVRDHVKGVMAEVQQSKE